MQFLKFSKRIKFTGLLILFFVFSQTTNLLAQDSSNDRKVFFKHLTSLVNNNYVFPEIAKKITQNITAKINSGYFKKYTDDTSFATAVVKELRSINGDLHFNVKPYIDEEKEFKTNITNYTNNLIDKYNDSRMEFSGFNSVQNLGNGVGYLNLSLFRPGKAVVDTYMRLIKSSDAVIVDLRGNRGGRVEIVNYLISYFFDEPIHLTTTNDRDGSSYKNWSTKVNGISLPDVPLFVLVDGRSASGAEGFSYTMQNLKRGTIIGETTRGAANSIGRWYFEGFVVSIPNERHISPITKTNWEGTGVTPDIKTNSKEAFDAALSLAKEAASKKRLDNDTFFKSQFTLLNIVIEKINENDFNDSLNDELYNILMVLFNKKVINESDINSFGYEYIRVKEQKVAEQIFKSNTLLNPNSANAFDSYAECLALNKKLNQSVVNYKKAVQLAVKQKSSRVNIYKKSLSKVQQMIKNK